MSAQVSSRSVKRYADALKRISASNRRALLRVLGGLDLENPGAAEYDAVVRAMETVTDAALSQVEIVAGGFYDGLRKQQTGKASTVAPVATRDPAAVEGAARGILAKYSQAGESRERIAEQLAGRIDYEVKQGATGVLYNMAAAEGFAVRRKIRFQRVTRGDTCEYCRMLASTGPFFMAPSNMGRSAHYHADCDCAYVPLFTESSSVQGMNVAAVYAAFRKDQLSKDYQQKAAAHGAALEARASGAANASTIEDDLLTAWADGSKVWEASPEVARWVLEDFKRSEYSWMLDKSYEELLSGFEKAHDAPELRRAYQTAMVYKSPSYLG